MSVDPKNVIRVTPPTGSDHALAINRDHTTGVGLLTAQDLSVTTSGRLGVWIGHTMIVGAPADHGEVADEAAMLALHDWPDDPHTRAVYHYVAPGDSCTRTDDPGYRYHCLSGHGLYASDWERRPLVAPVAALESRVDTMEIELAGKADATHTHTLSQVTASGTLGHVVTLTASGLALAAPTGGSGASGWIGNVASVAALIAGGYGVGAIATTSSMPNTVFISVAAPTSVASNWGAISAMPAHVAEILRHPDGRYVASDLTLTGSTRGTFAFVDRSDVYGYADGYRAVYVNGLSPSSSLRHASLVCAVASFVAANLDFAWRKVSRGDGTWDIQNPYSNYYLGYDTSTNKLRIVAAGDSRRVAWTIETA